MPVQPLDNNYAETPMVYNTALISPKILEAKPPFPLKKEFLMNGLLNMNVQPVHLNSKKPVAEKS
jgi:hypothetical protein